MALFLSACGGGGTNDTSRRATDGDAHDRPGEGPAGGGPTAAPPHGAGCAPSGTTLSIAAKDLKFDKGCLAGPAGRPISIEFNNAEALPHNVAIAREHNSPDVLFRGEIFTGPATRTYQVNALESGTYHFHCEVHPEMAGEFIVK